MKGSDFMGKKNYKELLEDVIKAKEKADKARQELALKIGTYILDKNEEVTSFESFKRWLSKRDTSNENI